MPRPGAVDVPRDRLLGQVFTPRPIADWMARWVCGRGPGRILDPAVGHGVFVEAVEDLVGTGALPTKPQIEVCEIDADLLRSFAERRAGDHADHVSVCCRHADFITAPFRHQFDAIIANPPYVRHHSMNYGPAVFAEFDRLIRRRLSRMTNLYGLFLVKIWTLLDQGGRAAVITPAEWLNADFGVALKAYLLEDNAFEAIVHFDHAASVFDGALTTAAITCLRRDRHRDEPIRLLRAADAEALDAIGLDDAARLIRPADLDPSAKWTPLFDAPVTPAKAPAVAADATVAPADCSAVRRPAGPVLGDIARCTRGIATGANDYFTLRESDRCRWGIEPADLRICITKAQDIAGPVLSPQRVQELIDADRRIHLLCPRSPLTTAVERYLAEGRRRGIHLRYLPSHRPIWYMPEHREPAPILVSVFARGAFRFVLNEAGALNLTAYHAIYLREPAPGRIRALFDYLISPAAQQALLVHRRIYADGLLKLEPRDVESLPIPHGLHRACTAQQRPPEGLFSRLST